MCSIEARSVFGLAGRHTENATEISMETVGSDLTNGRVGTAYGRENK